jgi:hypothetical protein
VAAPDPDVYRIKKHEKEKKKGKKKNPKKGVPLVGIEPTTTRLKAVRSTR